jgi:Leucine-rich repeat (LRR) protein
MCAIVVCCCYAVPFIVFAQKKQPKPKSTVSSKSSAISAPNPAEPPPVQQGPLLDSLQLLIQQTYTSLEEALRAPAKVYKLRLDGNDITPPMKMLSPEIGRLVNLQELSLAGNDLQTLPPEIGKLTNLQVLVLDKNKIKRLPKEIGQLQNLRRLFLNAYNQNVDAEESVVGEEHLGEELRALWQEIGKLPKLITLGLANNRLTGLPSALMSAKSLQDLYLNNNRLSEIQSSIGQLVELRQLDLSNNKLTSLPSSIGNLRNLEVLDVRLNKLKELPSEIGKLTNLHDLDVSYNSLPTLPDEICNLVNLRQLNISGNQLLTVPTDIGKLNLTRLKMIDNAILDYSDLQKKLYPLVKKRTRIDKDEPPRK